MARRRRQLVGPADYRSTLYNHALPPALPGFVSWRRRPERLHGRLQRPCRGVNLLMLDGSVKLVQPTIAPPVWREFASLPAPEDDSRQP